MESRSWLACVAADVVGSRSVFEEVGDEYEGIVQQVGRPRNDSLILIF